jgi:hypothetical protein
MSHSTSPCFNFFDRVLYFCCGAGGGPLTVILQSKSPDSWGYRHEMGVSVTFLPGLTSNLYPLVFLLSSWDYRCELLYLATFY